MNTFFIFKSIELPFKFPVKFIFIIDDRSNFKFYNLIKFRLENDPIVFIKIVLKSVKFFLSEFCNSFSKSIAILLH
jgi:hypothetical protein